MPVILCSRAADGAVCEQTYGYAGAEMDLLMRGLTPGGGLSALKARVLLTLCLGSDNPLDAFNRACRQV
jgi:L-asparaginase